MSDSVRPRRRQPTRPPRPWDSPGKNTGVGCHFLLQCMKGKSESEVAQSCPTLRDPMVCSLPGSSVHGIFQGRVLEWGAIAFSKRGKWSIIYMYMCICVCMWASLLVQMVKTACNAGDPGLIPGSGKILWKRSVFIPIPKKSIAKVNVQTTAQSNQLTSYQGNAQNPSS